jgi:hypothetical protein
LKECYILGLISSTILYDEIEYKFLTVQDGPHNYKETNWIKSYKYNARKWVCAKIEFQLKLRFRDTYIICKGTKLQGDSWGR